MKSCNKRRCRCYCESHLQSRKFTQVKEPITALLDMHHIYLYELAPSFVPLTSFCSLSSWFTSSCAYHLITVTTFALIIYHFRPFTPDLKLISFTNPHLRNLSGFSGAAFTDLNLHRTKWVLAFVCFRFVCILFCFWRPGMCWITLTALRF